MAEGPVYVVGAGVIGLATAVELLAQGRAVTIIDGGEPGRACSFGNAGIMAVSEVFPIISAERLKSLPATLLGADAPAVVRASAVPQLAPWLFRAAATLHSGRQQRIIEAIAALNSQAIQAWRDTLTTIGAQSLMRERGMLRLIRQARDLEPIAAHRTALTAAGVPSRFLSHEEVRELEPNLGGETIAALLHETDAHVDNPYAVSQAFLEYVRAKGGVVLREQVRAIEPRETGAHVHTRSRVFAAPQVVVTAGMGSKALLAPLGCVVPLQAERGYHLMLPEGGALLERPVTFHAESCVATPMGANLRLAGTVEFANEHTAPNWRRAQRLAPIAQRYFNSTLSASGAEKWVGSRPSLPDSLPAIGMIGGRRGMFYAFGHQHLGLTQAAVTAKLIASLIRDQSCSLDHRPYDLARFAKAFNA